MLQKYLNNGKKKKRPLTDLDQQVSKCLKLDNKADDLNKLAVIVNRKPSKMLNLIDDVKKVKKVVVQKKEIHKPRQYIDDLFMDNRNYLMPPEGNYNNYQLNNLLIGNLDWPINPQVS